MRIRLRGQNRVPRPPASRTADAGMRSRLAFFFAGRFTDGYSKGCGVSRLRPSQCSVLSPDKSFAFVRWRAASAQFPHNLVQDAKPQDGVPLRHMEPLH